jgi:iron complex transport system substrate-binding protein
VRIVCLSAEAADICARLGAWDEVLAVSAFASQAGLAPRPVIGGFSTTDCERIAALAPDLVICFSDVQAEIAAQLIRSGCAVLATNQRTLAEIASAIRLVGGAIGRAPSAEILARQFLDELTALAETAGPRPRVYFEEWPDPLISGIGWVGELIELCGGADVFAARRGRASRERVVQPEEVIAANPDIIIASWCGRRVEPEAIRARPGFSAIRAVRDEKIHTIESDLLLQPGPGILAGARELKRIFAAWQRHACIATPPHPP